MPGGNQAEVFKPIETMGECQWLAVPHGDSLRLAGVPATLPVPTAKPSPPLFRPCRGLCFAGQLKEVLRFWGGERVNGAKPRAPRIEGTLGKLSCAPEDKAQWTKVVLDMVEPENSHAPGNKLWDRLRRTMPPSARALLLELGGAGDGQPPNA